MHKNRKVERKQGIKEASNTEMKQRKPNESKKGRKRKPKRTQESKQEGKKKQRK